MNFEDTIRTIIREELNAFFDGAVVTKHEPEKLADLVDKATLMQKFGNPHPSTWWRWEKSGKLGTPVIMGTKKMYKLSEVLIK